MSSNVKKTHFRAYSQCDDSEQPGTDTVWYFNDQINPVKVMSSLQLNKHICTGLAYFSKWLTGACASSFDKHNYPSRHIQRIFPERILDRQDCKVS